MRKRIIGLKKHFRKYLGIYVVIITVIGIVFISLDKKIAEKIQANAFWILTATTFYYAVQTKRLVEKQDEAIRKQDEAIRKQDEAIRKQDEAINEEKKRRKAEYAERYMKECCSPLIEEVTAFYSFVAFQNEKDYLDQKNIFLNMVNRITKLYYGIGYIITSELIDGLRGFIDYISNKRLEIGQDEDLKFLFNHKKEILISSNNALEVLKGQMEKSKEIINDYVGSGPSQKFDRKSDQKIKEAKNEAKG